MLMSGLNVPSQQKNIKKSFFFSFPQNILILEIFSQHFQKNFEYLQNILQIATETKINV